jgi:hypothetical protein
MRLSNFRIPFAVIGLVLMSSVSMTLPVQAINPTTCKLRGDFLKITQENKTKCFANAGALSVNLTKVHRLTSGDNAGHVMTDRGIYTFKKWDIVEFHHKGGSVTITEIYIN